MINHIQPSSNINFLGYKTKFSKDFEKYLSSDGQNNKERERLADSFESVIKTRMNDKYNLGEGRFHLVYKIDDYHVFRIPDEERPYVELPKKRRNVKHDNLGNLKTYFGKVLATFGNVEIIKNTFGSARKGLNAGVPYRMSEKYYNMLHNGVMPPESLRNAITKHYNEVYLPTFSKLPQRAYDNVVKDFVALNKSSPEDLIDSFDFNNPNNFIQVGKSIRVIDDLTPRFSESNISNLTNVFLRDYGVESTPESDKMKREIFDKCMIAAMKNDFIDGSIKMGKTLDFVGIEEPVEIFAQNVKDISKLSNRKKIPALKEYLATI